MLVRAQYWLLSHLLLAMSNNSPSIVRKPASDDPRARRSAHALGAALVQLMVEDDFENVTVQRILDRAGVGRSTFYAHFRNKHDVLHSSYEQMFVWLEQQLDDSSPTGVRIVPVAEFLEHIGNATPVVNALRSSGQLQDFSDLSVGFLGRMIERHIAPAAGTRPTVPAALISRMLAGALMEMIEWWNSHPSGMTRAQMDATFHVLARTLLRGASYEPRPVSTY